MPARYNIGVDVCDRWARLEPRRTAIFNVRADGDVDEISYGWLRETSNRLANVLSARGIRRGDRVAILLPQAPAVAAAHVAIYKLGAIALPLAMLFGVEAISYRLADSGARALITNAQGLAKLAGIRDALPALVLSVDGPGDGAEGFFETLARASPEFAPVDTAADDPALMVYTSGTTGPPKGALHAHRVLLGHLPGIEFPHEFLPQPGDRFWTPADWAWAGGLLNVLLPGLHYGVPVVAARHEKFDPEEAFALMAQDGGAQRLHPADGAAHAALGAASARRRPPALGRLGRRGARRRDLRMGPVGARPHHQRVLRPDRMQPGARLLRGDRRVAPGRDRQAGARPHRRGDPARTARHARRASSARSPSSGPIR